MKLAFIVMKPVDSSIDYSTKCMCAMGVINCICISPLKI